MEKEDFFYYMDDVFGERPELIDDLVYHLTGIEMLPVKQFISENAELELKKPCMPKADNDENLAELKRKLGKLQY